MTGGRFFVRIYVYAIAKDEEAFAARWMASMAEADGVYVLDTGSRDATAARLEALGAHVERRDVRPWRFDTARNISMDLVPEDGDILVCTDLDEVLRPGWRAALEAAWRPECTTARYEYVWSFNPDGSDGVKYLYEKVHRPGVCRWTHPVHEVLRYQVPQVWCDVPGMRLEHHPDRSKSREDYLRLLELSVAEDPQDDRNRHYLGREYMFRGRWDEAIRTLREHLAMPAARWRPERAASMRYIARCLLEKGDREGAELWLLRAVWEAPEQREALVALARLMHDQGRWAECERYCRRALDITSRDMSYTTEAEAWGALPWDLLSLACWHQGDARRAADCAREALKLAPDDRRIRDNLALMEGASGDFAQESGEEGEKPLRYE